MNACGFELARIASTATVIYTHKPIISTRPHPIQIAHTHRAIRAVLEADGERDTARELAMELRLGGARADGAPGDEVGNVLRGDGVEQFRADGHAEAGEVAEQLARKAKTLVNLEGAVDVRVVDEPLPADSRARFLRRRASDTQRADAVRERRASLPRWEHIST